jgi:predicted transcriptional regulator
MEIIHYPNLKTILMIEGVLKKSQDSISKNEIMKRLPKKIMRQTLNTALNYLESKNIVFCGDKGVTWIFNPNNKIREQLVKGVKH